MAINVIILAPYTLHQAAWEALLADQPGIRVAGAIGEPSEIPSVLPPGEPTTILIDLAIPQEGIARQINSHAPHSGLLFLVETYELSQIVPLLQAGANGCIARSTSVGELARAIIAASRGEFVLPPEVAVQSLLALGANKSTGINLHEPLSEREIDVLRLLAFGSTNKDIAQTLFLSVRTVEAHLRRIFAKLGVGSRTEAALWAVQHGYSERVK